MSDKGRTVQIITVVRFRVVSCHSGQRIGGYRHKQLLRRRGRTGRAHVRARDGCSAAIVRAWKAECAEEAAATSGGMQSSVAAQKDGGSGTPRALHDVGGTPIFRFFAPHLGYQRDPGDFVTCCRLACRMTYSIEIDVFDGQLCARNRRFRHGLLLSGLR